MVMHKLLIAILLTAFGQVFAQANTKLYIEGQVVCPVDDKGHSFNYCTYTLVNLTRAQELIRKVEQVLFKGDPLTPPSGMLEALGNNNKVITFWHVNAEVLMRMKEVIPLLDTKESFYPNTVVEFKTDIYEVSETGLNNLSAEITNLRLGQSAGNGNSFGVNVDSNGLGLDLKLGVVELSGLLAAERQKGNLIRKITINRPVPNLSSIQYEDRTIIYQAPGAGTTIKEDYAGITLNGTVSVNDNNSSLVTVKNFQLTYGTRNEDGTINKVTLPYENLVIEEGVAFPLVSSKTIGRFNSRSTRILGISNRSMKEDAKLLVYVSVKVRSWDEYLESIRGLLTVGKQRFDKEELESLPTLCIKPLAMLNNLQAMANRDHQGDPVLSMALDKKDACQTNIKTRIKVSISGEGISKKDNIKIVTVESLMHIPIKINEIPLAKLRKSQLRFKITLELMDKNEKTIVHHRLNYAPSDYMIGENIWLD
jgi:hypothetical protein